MITPASEPWPVTVDPSPIDQVLMNLAVNARDARPRGGKLILTTANVTLGPDHWPPDQEAAPGDYVLLAVSDTGAGMSQEVKDRIFEVFFTTKEVGKGTGLGLASCRTIIAGSGGHMRVDSQLGLGTTFNIYLPRADAAVQAAPAATEEELGPLPQGQELVLVVDDEPSLRAVVSSVLREQGYSGLAAANGVQDLDMAQEQVQGEILLLHAALVMRQMSGTSCTWYCIVRRSSKYNAALLPSSRRRSRLCASTLSRNAGRSSAYCSRLSSSPRESFCISGLP